MVIILTEYGFVMVIFPLSNFQCKLAIINLCMLINISFVGSLLGLIATSIYVIVGTVYIVI